MLRLSLAARITLIVLVALLAVWIAAIAFFYRSQIGEGGRSVRLPNRSQRSLT